MKKQTAVEWYNDEIDQLVSMLITNQLSISRYNELQNKLLEQAKAMEKEHIIDAILQSVGMKDDEKWVNLFKEQAEQYYNKTFKSE